MSRESDNAIESPMSRKLLIVLLVGSMFPNVLLARRMHLLKSGAFPRTPAGPSILGVSLPELPVLGLNGRSLSLRFSSQAMPTVLYVMNPRCHWCELNVDSIKSLGKSVGSRYRLIGLSIDDGSLRKYAETHDLGFPIYALSSYSVAPQLYLGSTPETIVISEEGKVSKFWLGGYTGPNQSDVEEYFSTRLPTISLDGVR